MLAPTEKKIFPALLVASAATGICLGSGVTIARMQEVYDHVLGHPVWTHELPSYGPEVHRLLREQFPQMPTEEEAQADWQPAAAAMTAAYGAELSVRGGFGERTKSPVETLAEIVDPKKIIVVDTSRASTGKASE